VTDLNGRLLQESNGIADDGNVLITIGTSEVEGMIRRWGVVSNAIGDLSVEALIRGAVDDRVLELLRSQRPQQHQSEEQVTAKVKEILSSGYRIFVRDSDDPIDSARAGQVRARALLSRGHPEYQTQSFYLLHLTVEPFGAAGLAPHHDDTGAATAVDALRRDMSAQRAQAASTQAGAAAATAAAPTPVATEHEEYRAKLDTTTVAAQEARTPSVETSAAGYCLATSDEPSVVAAAREAGVLPETDPASETYVSEPPHVSAPAVAVEEDLHDTEVVAGANAEVEPEIEIYEAQPKKHVTKGEALMEQFSPKVQALDFRGLFVGNFGFQRDTVVDVAKLSALSPQTISAYLMKANSLRQTGEHEKALSYYRVLLKSDPDNADYRFLYGKTLLEMGRVQPARECLERARELGHENAAHELEQWENREAKKPALAFLQFWRRAEAKR
jgi:tetratricopeptide (TPR) repeat protein